MQDCKRSPTINQGLSRFPREPIQDSESPFETAVPIRVSRGQNARQGGTSSMECIRERTEYFSGSRISESGDDKVLTRSRKRESGPPVTGNRLGEALIDIQTIIIVGLLYWLLREEQDNAYLRTWLFNNFPLGLYLLSPLTVVAISGTLLILTVARIVLFVTDSNRTLVEEVLQRLKGLKEQLLELNTAEKSNYSAMILTSFGTVLALYSYFISRIIPLVALGISCIILGFTALSLPRQIGGGPGMRAMLEGATLSVEALLEASTVGRATYLPPADGGIIFAYIPLGPQSENLSLNEMRQAPKSLIGDIKRDCSSTRSGLN